MTNETQNQTEETTQTSEDTNRPDYFVKQYRVTKVEDGWKTRKERIGAAWNGANGAISIRLAGTQIIEGDMHLFPSTEPSMD